MNLLLFPDSRLTTPCTPVTEFNEELRTTAANMLVACRKWHGYALAAPQVGILKRFFVVCSATADKRGKYPSLQRKPLIICNPIISQEEGTFSYPESCLSMPGVVGNLIRPASFMLTYDDSSDEPVIANTSRERTLHCTGLFARIIQHEIDHLDGKLFVDRLDPITRNRVYPAINKLRTKR